MLGSCKEVLEEDLFDRVSYVNDFHLGSKKRTKKNPEKVIWCLIGGTGQTKCESPSLICRFSWDEKTFSPEE